MSFTRLTYDTCAYKWRLNQSVGPLSYILNPRQFVNHNKRRMNLHGEENTGQIKGNLVDLENDLRGITRKKFIMPKQ